MNERRCHQRMRTRQATLALARDAVTERISCFDTCFFRRCCILDALDQLTADHDAIRQRTHFDKVVAVRDAEAHS